MRRSLVVAIANNGVIGRDGDLPWRLPDDLRAFRRHTLGKAVIMGRRTWESLPNGALAKRLNLVVTRQPTYAAEGATVVGSLDAAFDAAREAGCEEAVVIGGASLYAEALRSVDAMVVTHVDADVDGDVRMPPIDWAAFEERAREAHPADERHAHAFRIVEYARR